MNLTDTQSVAVQSLLNTRGSYAPTKGDIKGLVGAAKKVLKVGTGNLSEAQVLSLRSLLNHGALFPFNDGRFVRSLRNAYRAALTMELV